MLDRGIRGRFRFFFSSPHDVPRWLWNWIALERTTPGALCCSLPSRLRPGRTRRTKARFQANCLVKESHPAAEPLSQQTPQARKGVDLTRKIYTHWPQDQELALAF